jgi:hypothetical protein
VQLAHRGRNWLLQNQPPKRLVDAGGLNQSGAKIEKRYVSTSICKHFRDYGWHTAAEPIAFKAEAIAKTLWNTAKYISRLYALLYSSAHLLSGRIVTSDVVRGWVGTGSFSNHKH